MARALDALTEHWLQRKGQQRTLTVRLGNQDFPFWWSAWTLGQQDYVFHGHKSGEPLRPERMAMVVVRKAENEKGERLFADIELVDLLNNVDPDVVKAMAIAILTDLQVDNAAGGTEGAGDPKAMAPGGTPTT